MRTAIPLALLVMFAAGCGPNDEQGVLPCGSGDGFEQRLPAAGLSAVETSGVVPEQVTLAPNPSLIDGDVASSTGVDLGYGPTLRGDSAFRDMGLKLADAATAVDELRVWVDGALPPEVATSYSWSAYRSDDNVTWAVIPLAGPVRFGISDARFEIPIARTEARYLKVVTRPLAAGISTEPAFEFVSVTEMQGFLSGTCNTPS